MPFPAHEDGDPRSLAPFETTPLLRVEESVAMASITEADVVCDLGCGNARSGGTRPAFGSSLGCSPWWAWEALPFTAR